MKSLNKLTDEIIDKVVSEVSKQDNLKKIETKIIDPLIDYSFKRIYPYIVATAIVFILIIILSLIILLLLLSKLNKS